MEYEDSRWRYAAAGLGVGLIEPIGGFDPKACFPRLLRASGGPAGPKKAGVRLWMSGRMHVAPLRRDVDVMVIPDVETSQSGTSANATTTQHHYTYVVARIDPPLFVGLDLALERGVELFGKMPSIPIGDPAFDNSFLLNAKAAHLVAPLFRRSLPPPNDVVDHLFALARHGRVHISDSTVAIKTSFEDEPTVLGPRVAAAASLAAFVASRRGPLPRDAGEDAMLAPWKAVAAREHLTFDASRLTLAGRLDGGSEMRLAIETERAEHFTSLALTLPQSLDLGLQLTRQGAFQFLKGIFGSQDIEIGDETFDDAFVVKGKDVAGVKALFGRSPAAGQALVELLAWSPDLVVHDGGLFARWPSVANETAIQRAIQLARVVSAAFTPHAPSGQAYR